MKFCITNLIKREFVCYQTMVMSKFILRRSLKLSVVLFAIMSSFSEAGEIKKEKDGASTQPIVSYTREDLEKEIEKLKKENSALKGELADLKKKINPKEDEELKTEDNALEEEGSDVSAKNPVFKKIKSGGEYTKYSWKADVTNSLDEAKEVGISFCLLDEDGFVIDDCMEIQKIPAKKTVKVSDTKMVENNVFKKAKSCKVSIE